MSRDELGRDIRELRTKSLHSFLGPDIDNSLRKQLEELWGCDVYDLYGTNEMGGAGFECGHKNGVHVMEDWSFFWSWRMWKRASRSRRVKPETWLSPSCRRNLPPVVLRYNVRDLARTRRRAKPASAEALSSEWTSFSASDDMVKLRGVNVYP